jgi:hypothetical protein
VMISVDAEAVEPFWNVAVTVALKICFSWV